MLFSIQALRFVAAFGVLLHHVISEIGSKISVFAAGVDIFFVISGFIISYSTRSDEGIVEFSVKRLIRIFPIYWFCTALYIFLHWWYWQDVPKTSYLIQSIFLIPTLGENWFPVYFAGWTLVYECAFYGLFALMMLVNAKHYRILCMCTLLALSSVLLPSPVSGTYLHSDILIEFVFGMLIAELLPYLRRADPAVGSTLVAAALLAFAYNWGGQTPTRPFAWGVPAAMLVAGAVCFDGVGFFASPAVRILGGSSYAIYLTHLTIIHWIEVTFGRNHVQLQDHKILHTVILIPAALVGGVLVHLLVERPMLKALRHLLMSKIREKRSIAFGALARGKVQHEA